MTREEIINNLLHMKRYVKEDTTEDSTIDEAIKALEQQTCEEGERMTALEKWKNDFKGFISELSIPKDDYDGIMEYINEVPNEALEQQPCDDCISRQAVNDLVDELARAISDERCCISRGRSTATIVRDIRHLPPITPKEKTGKWIPLGNYDEWGNENSYKCSECGERNFHPDNYCHNCGAKMQEVKE